MAQSKRRPQPMAGEGEPERLAPEHGGSDDGGMAMEQRVARLEEDMKEVKLDLKGLRSDVASLRSEVAEIKGRLSELPTTFQMLIWFVGVAIGLTGLVFLIARVTAGM